MRHPGLANAVFAVIALLAALVLGCRSAGPGPAPDGVPLYPAEWDSAGRQYPIGWRADEEEGAASVRASWWRTEFRDQLTQPVSFDFVNVSLTDAIAYLRELTNLNIRFEPGAPGPAPRITLRRENVPLGEALRDMLKQIGYDYMLRDGAIYVATVNRIEADRELPTVFYDAEQWKPLEEELNWRVAFDFDDVDADAAFSDLGEMTGVPVVLDTAYIEPRKIWRITLAVKDMQAKRALAWMCWQLDLGYTVINKTVFVSEQDRLLTTPAAVLGHQLWLGPSPELGRALDESISAAFVEKDLTDVIHCLRLQKDLNILLDPKGVPDKPPKVTLRADEMSVGAVLNRICKQTGLAWTARGDVILISSPERLRRLKRSRPYVPGDAPSATLAEKLRKPVSLAFGAGTPLEDMLLIYFRNLTGTNIVLGRGITRARPLGWLTLWDVPFDTALGGLCLVFDVRWTIKDDVIFVGTPDRVKKRVAEAVHIPPPKATVNRERKTNARLTRIIETRLKRPISVHFIETPLQDCVAFWRGFLDVNIVLDQKAVAERDRGVTLRLDEVPAASALGWMCFQCDLKYTITDGAIFVSTAERIKKRLQEPVFIAPKDMPEATRKALNKHVSFDLIATPLKDVAAFLSGLRHAPVVLAKPLPDEDLDVTLQLDNVRYRDALNWICWQTGLKWTVRKDGTILITTPDDEALKK
ncbi:MAG: STN domain-containing protein [Planctomycetota bacterium]